MSNRYERNKIEQSERAWELFDPEGYAKAKAAESAAESEFFKQNANNPRCPECGSIMRIRDSYLHTVATAWCKCGYTDYV